MVKVIIEILHRWGLLFDDQLGAIILSGWDSGMFGKKTSNCIISSFEDVESLKLKNCLEHSDNGTALSVIMPVITETT